MTLQEKLLELREAVAKKEKLDTKRASQSYCASYFEVPQRTWEGWETRRPVMSAASLRWMRMQLKRKNLGVYL